MAVPKFKTSKARTKRRRGVNMRLTPPTLITCTNCSNKVLRHRVCPRCGFYRGKQVLTPETNG